LSVGLLIEETEQFIKIAQGVSDTQVIGRVAIPRCAIMGIKEIK
jgi:hypothetical protein